ncbi:MAG TPA: chromate resistance protein ChrB domain-containing protein [Gemmatimonadaceae bacterium]|nr:chromate resistance protein ChrB domain-containing protein [Gemmatimonadaceae bacterium]
MSQSRESGAPGWVLLIHQIPPKPDYLRVKIGRRLQRVGAIAVKNSVYVLPDGDQSVEDFQWIRREIVDGGGDASVCRAAFIDGLTDDQLRDAFRAARDADYEEIARAARALQPSARARGRDSGPGRGEDEISRLRKRFAAVAATDFFEAAGRAAADKALTAVETKLAPANVRQAVTSSRVDRGKYRARTWVTRKGVFVDRMASAWLIRRFIDPDARFRFVDPETYRPMPGELRFDMFEGEFTHEGDRCTFETLLHRFGLDSDPALTAVAEVVHDIDLKDAKYERPDTPGIETLLTGIARNTPNDEERIEHGGALFAALYASARGAASGESASD